MTGRPRKLNPAQKIIMSQWASMEGDRNGSVNTVEIRKLCSHYYLFGNSLPYTATASNESPKADAKSTDCSSDGILGKIKKGIFGDDHKPDPEKTDK